MSDRARRRRPRRPPPRRSPARRTECRAATARQITTARLASAGSVSSTMHTASAPGGSGAPVMMRTAWPGPTVRSRRAGHDRADHPQADRVPRAGVRGPDGVAVHRGVGEGRDGLLGADVSRTTCPGDRRVRPERVGAAGKLSENEPLGFGEGDHSDVRGRGSRRSSRSLRPRSRASRSGPCA